VQIVDDILDLTASSSILGKPALNDIKSGLATVPVLFAAEEYPELRALILRKFKGSGDLSQVREGAWPFDEGQVARPMRGYRVWSGKWANACRGFCCFCFCKAALDSVQAAEKNVAVKKVALTNDVGCEILGTFSPGHPLL
jgi:Polyprenyl synthetase